MNGDISKFLSPEMMHNFINRILEDVRRDLEVLEKRISENEKKDKPTYAFNPPGMLNEQRTYLQFCIEYDRSQLNEIKKDAINKLLKYINKLPEDQRQNTRDLIINELHGSTYKELDVEPFLLNGNVDEKLLNDSLERVESEIIDSNAGFFEISTYLADVFNEIDSWLQNDKGETEKDLRSKFNDIAKDSR